MVTMLMRLLSKQRCYLWNYYCLLIKDVLIKNWGIALHFLADVQFKKLQQALNRTIIWLQPLLFLLIAMMIIAVYMSVLLPVYQMMEGF